MTERMQKLAARNLWNEMFELRDEQRGRWKSAIQVVKRRELPLEKNRQGLMRWYMHPKITDTILNTMMFFEQEIPPGGRSGRLKFQGGQVIFILEGKGYTVIDGVKHAWEAEDMLNLPVRPDGIIVQHFNADREKRVRFVAAETNWVDCTGVDRGCGFEQLEDAPG